MTPPAIGLHPYLAVALFLFSAGLYGVLTRRNAMAVLMGVELMLNAVNLNLVAFSRFASHAQAKLPAGVTYAPEIAGQAYAVFVVTVAVAEAAVGIALVILIYRDRDLLFVERYDRMRG